MWKMVALPLMLAFFLAVGIILIVKGGDIILWKPPPGIAEVSAFQKLIVGATNRHLATTLPEMLVP